MEQLECQRTAAALGGVADVIFHMTGTMGFQNQGIVAERHNIDVAENALGINLLPLFRNKDLCDLFECYVHNHSVTLKIQKVEYSFMQMF